MTTRESALTDFHRHLDASEFEEALAFFADDAVMIRPVILPPGVLAGNSSLHEDTGIEGIREWLRKRGKRPTRHEFSNVAVRGDHAFAEGTITVGAATLADARTQSARFLMHATFDEDDKFIRLFALRG
jgi:ketosteroid isomerase-like protein